MSYPSPCSKCGFVHYDYLNCVAAVAEHAKPFDVSDQPFVPVPEPMPPMAEANLILAQALQSLSESIRSLAMNVGDLAQARPARDAEPPAQWATEVIQEMKDKAPSKPYEFNQTAISQKPYPRKPITIAIDNIMARCTLSGEANERRLRQELEDFARIIARDAIWPSVDVDTPNDVRVTLQDGHVYTVQEGVVVELVKCYGKATPEEIQPFMELIGNIVLAKPIELTVQNLIDSLLRSRGVG